MRQPILWLPLAAVLLALPFAPWWAPPVLREVPWFAVARVEVVGTRLLAPHDVLSASGIRAGQNVWDDHRAWEAALRAHPMVAGVAIERRLPRTLRVQVEEKKPVALVERETLRLATAAGELLPLDPSRSGVDLPIVRGSEAAPAATLPALLAETARLGELRPGLLARISEVRWEASGTARLTLSRPFATVILPAGVEVSRLAELDAVLDDLERRAPDRGGHPSIAEIDLRYAGQIVVRFSSPV